MVKTNDMNPHFFGYGSLFFYINAIVYWAYYLLGRMVGLFSSVSDIPDLQMLGMGVGRSFMPTEIIAGRLVSVLLGTLCIPVAYWLGAQLSSRRVGLLAAVLVTFSAPLVTHSQFITPNILATFLVLLTLAVLVWSTPRRPYLSSILIGLAFGCAVASKYNAALLVIPIGVAYFLQYGWRVLKRPDLYISLAVAGLTFLAVTPYALLDFIKFWDDTVYHLQYYRTASHPGMEGNTISFYLNYLLKQEGLVVFLSVVPVIGYIRTRNRTGLILASFAIPYTLYISTLDIRNDRTILITLPILLIMAADVLGSAWQRIQKSNSLRFRQFALALLTAFVMLSTTYLIYKTTEANVKKTTPDAREYARQWIETNIPDGTRIAFESYSPFIDPARYNVAYVPQLALNSPDWYSQQGYDLLVFSSGQFARFYANPDRYSEQVAMYDALWEQFPEIAHFDQNGITIRVYQVSK
jgi:4-amino-4-deoxy-L-arabinose transferase-like glycosyltransferase